MPRRKIIKPPKTDLNMNGEGTYKEPNKPIKVLTKQSIKDKLKEL